MASDRIEFEDDAPLELTSSDELEPVSKDEVNNTSEAVEKIFTEEKVVKAARNKKLKQKKPGLKLQAKKMKKDKYKPKDYIAVRCQLCDAEYTHAKKDDNGAFIPFALCQHVIFKGVFVE